MFLGKYNTARHIYIPIVKRGVVDHAVSADWTPAAGDVKISKDGAAAANVTNLPTAIAMGNSTIWDFSLTATEMSAAQVMVTIADSTTKAVEDSGFIVETYGNASAQHGFDLATATQKVDLDTIKTNPVVNAGTVTFPTTATLASTTNITAATGIDVTKLLGTAWLAPGTAGTPDVNVKLWNALATVALPLVPTTAGRTLDVSAGGEAGLDWANIGSPTTSVALTGTTIAVTQKVDVDTIKTNPVVNGGTVTFTTNSTVASTTGAVGSVTGAVGSVTGAVGSVTGNVGGSVVGSVGSIANGGIAAASFAANAIDAAAIANNAIDRATFAADTGLQTIRSNTTQSATGTTIVLDASASAVDSFYNNDIVFITGGTGVGQARFISAYVGATKTATVATWFTNPDNTSTFAILPFDAVAGASAPTAAQVATAVWQDATAGDFTTSGSIGKSLFTSGVVPGASGGLFIAGSNAATTVNITGNLTGNVTGSVGSVTGNVGGNVVGSVASVTAGVTVTTNNDKTGYGLSGTQTFNNTGTWTGNLVGTVSTLTTYTGNTPQTGDAFARLGAPAGASVSADIAAMKVDTAAIKVQSDKLTFTIANQIDANVLDWKSATAPAMTGDAFARLGAPAGASVSVDIAAIKTVSDAIKIRTDLIPGTIDGKTFAQVITLTGAVLLGKASGLGTATAIFRSMDDAKDRVTASVDASGNRTSVTLDAS